MYLPETKNDSLCFRLTPTDSSKFGFNVIAS